MTGTVPGVRGMCKDADFDTTCIFIKQVNSKEAIIMKRVADIFMHIKADVKMYMSRSKFCSGKVKSSYSLGNRKNF